MFSAYLNLIIDIISHIFRAIGACAVLLPFAYFSGVFAINMCNGLSVILGLISGASVVLAVAATYMELEQVVENIRAFRHWCAAIQNI